MGWEQRGNLKYYYRKKRVGNRVVSEYLGRGKHVEKILRLEENERQKIRERNEQEALEIDRIRVESERIESLFQSARTLTHSILIASGYHTHKGQWRRRRVKSPHQNKTKG